MHYIWGTWYSFKFETGLSDDFTKNNVSQVDKQYYENKDKIIGHFLNC